MWDVVVIDWNGETYVYAAGLDRAEADRLAEAAYADGWANVGVARAGAVLALAS